MKILVQILIFFVIIISSAIGQTNYDIKRVQEEIESNSSEFFKSLKFGIQIEENFNYSINHNNISFNLNFKNHEISIGPEYSRFLKKMYEMPDKQDKIDYLGLNFSYKYNIKSSWDKINLFLEFKYFIYKLKYESYSGHYAGLEEKQKIIIENTGGLGIRYKLSNKIELYGGLGIGSYDGFFLMIENFIPHSFIGLKYVLN